ncbi:hypothetical protein [Youngiibacter fragilis]|uniref:Uncharacterized protein n=1 Tax=Youngiibacter fragilis 232.1 TaxID=994573 RepID=V7IB87_9CLOT|nr:hypothetical protein [Youngiibacter fragilis]ETA82122.1 hypothetical protein T472_0202855 [Youngiibacter fragilis 232.1]
MGYEIWIMEFGISDSDMDEYLSQSWLEERMELWPGEGRSARFSWGSR